MLEKNEYKLKSGLPYARWARLPTKITETFTSLRRLSHCPGSTLGTLLGLNGAPLFWTKLQAAFKPRPSHTSQFLLLQAPTQPWTSI